MPRWSPYPAETDRALAVGLTEADGDALGALYDAYAGRLYDYVLSVTGETRSAADIVHDVFIDAARRAPRMRDHRDLRAWLYGAARRRVLQHGRADAPFWETDAEFSPVAEVPPGELRELSDAAFRRLDADDQEALLLALRHGLAAGELAHVWGVATRRAAARRATARAALDAAFAEELDRAAERCAALPAPETEDTLATVPPAPRPGPAGAAGLVTGGPSPAEPAALERHRAACPRCRDRAEVPAAALPSAAPAPVLPAALRHRVLHTATDPELAGYRVDIAARGGTLTPEGMPVQPDVASPFTRRWLLTGGGMAGALVAALVAALMITVPAGTVHWNSGPKPTPVISRTPASDALRSPVGRAPGNAPPAVRPHGRRTPAAPGDDGTPGTDPSPTPVVPGRPKPPAPPKPGTLVVAPAEVNLGNKKTAQVTITAKDGPVDWRVVSSSDKVTVSQEEGDLGAGASGALTIKLRNGFLGLPGEAELTFIDETGEERRVAVEWGVTLV